MKKDKSHNLLEVLESNDFTMEQFVSHVRNRLKNENLNPDFVKVLVESDPSLLIEFLNLNKELLDKLNSFEIEKKNAILQMLRDAVIFVSTDSDLNLIRNAISSSKEFVPNDNGSFRKEIVNSKGHIRGIAEVRSTDDDVFPELPEIWGRLVEETLSSLDDLTADLFDLVLYLWCVMKKDEHGYIDFDSDFALSLRFAKPLEEIFSVRERERFAIMKRVAAISGIWISTRVDDVSLKVGNEIDKNDYNFADFSRMFEVTSIKMAYDKKTNEPKGVYSLKIKPAPLMEKYVKDFGQTFGPLDIKVFSYHYIKQREHKRLTRYFNTQWKINAVKRRFRVPFKVETLVNACDFAARKTFADKREILESTLNDLVEDEVISNWGYENEDLDVVMSSSKSARQWLKSTIVVTPPQSIADINSKKIVLEDVVNAFKFPDLNTDVVQENVYESLKDLSASSMLLPYNELDPLEVIDEVNNYISKNKISIRSVANELKFTFSTLQRYLGKQNNTYKKTYINKLYLWLKSKENNSDLMP